MISEARALYESFDPEMLARLRRAFQLDLVSAKGETTQQFIQGRIDVIDQTLLARRMRPAAFESAQPCGCDPGANWTCEQHRGQEVQS